MFLYFDNTLQKYTCDSSSRVVIGSDMYDRRIGVQFPSSARKYFFYKSSRGPLESTKHSVQSTPTV
jgi:hypothetical protein